ncbi:MAG: protein DA1 [Kistimonas sp.]|nr:protein DA1 [Kistimonas sp.]
MKSTQTVHCHRCGKPITGEFTKALGRTWHRSCFLCCGCRKPILGSFIRKDGEGWHPACFQKAWVPNCAVCNAPLMGACLQDYWGNLFCESHQDYATCVSCGRIVCGPLTGGGIRFSDGLTVCHLCTVTGVTDTGRAIQLAGEMRAVLKGMGLDLFQAETPVRLVDRGDLHSKSRHNFHAEHPLLGLAVWSTSLVGKRVVSRDFQEILIQSHLSEDHFRTVVLHELGHAWVFYNNPLGRTIPLQVEEGFCVLLEYLWLKKQGTKDARYRMSLIEGSQDPVYGVGFQGALRALKRLPLPVLARYILEKRRFPSALGAFFYH